MDVNDRKERREAAQDALMDFIAAHIEFLDEYLKVHYPEYNDMTDEDRRRFEAEIVKQADRAARFFGYIPEVMPWHG